MRILDKIWRELSEDYYDSILVQSDVLPVLFQEYKEELENSDVEFFGQEVEVVDRNNLKLSDLSNLLGLEIIEDVSGEIEETFKLFNTSKEGNT